MSQTHSERHWIVDDKILYDPIFQEAIQTSIECGDDFYTILNAVCGVITSHLIFEPGSTSGMGGGSLERCRALADPFELVIFDMLAKFDGHPNDFRFTFFDTWTLLYSLRRSGMSWV